VIDWNPDSHPPKGVFDKPHFDSHFYMTDMASVMAIDPRDPHYTERAAHLPEARYVPAGYQPELGPPAVLTKPPMIQERLSQPTEFQRTGYFPTVDQIFYDGSADIHEISLDGILMHQAS
jgi:hypothetical protein